MLCHGLTGWQTNTLPPLQITNSERMVVIDLAIARDRQRQLKKRTHKPSIDLLRALSGWRADGIEEHPPINNMLARYRSKAQQIWKEWKQTAVSVQLIPVTDLRMTISIARVGKLKWYKRIFAWMEISSAFSTHVCSGLLPNERGKKFVQDDPLIMPAHLTRGFLKNAVISYAVSASFVDKGIVCLQHCEMELRDKHVRIIARITDDCSAIFISLNICFIYSEAKLRRIVTLKEIGMARRSISIKAFQI